MAQKTVVVGVPSFSPGTAATADIIDEDDMFSDLATAVPSQQSVKAYVDSNSSGSSIEAHENSLTPHTAYDDMQSITLLFENGLI